MVSENRKSSKAKEASGVVSTRMTRLPGRILIISMVMVGPWMIGSISGGSQALLCLLGLIALGFWWLEIAVLRPKQVVMPLSVIPILLGIGLGVVHFWPLPDSVAETLGAGHAYQQWEEFTSLTDMDRQLIDKIQLQTGADAEVFSQPPVKSISIDPQATRLMTAQLVLAAICYLLGAHFFHSRRSLIWLCTFMTVNGVALALFGIVQKMSSGTGELFFGALKVSGGVFSSYVNRNNASGLLVMCLAAAVMLVVETFGDTNDEDSENELLNRRHAKLSGAEFFLQFVHELNARKLAAVFAVVFIVGGIVVSLSRGGTLAMLAGSVVSLLVMGMSQQRKRNNGLLYLGVAVFFGLMLVSWLGFGEQILNRFEEVDNTDVIEQARVENWLDTSSAIPDQWLVGSGLSTYQHVHRPFRSSTETSVFVYAENQYFQSLLDGGVLGLSFLILMIAWSIYFVGFLIKTSGSSGVISVGLMGCFALVSQAVAAFFDFGLYIPANTVTFAILIGAVAGQAQVHAKRFEDTSYFARLGFGPFAIVMLLLLFSGGMLSLFEFYRLDQVEQACVASREIREKEYRALPEEVNQSLVRLAGLAKNRSEVSLHQAISEQLVQRYRLRELQKRTEGVTDLPDETLQELWAATNATLQANFIRQISELNQTQAKRLKVMFLSNAELQANLLPAYGELLLARKISPMVPEVNLRLAELGMVVSDLDPSPHLERAIKVAPGNPNYQFLAGIQTLRSIDFDLSSERFEPAMQHLRNALSLSPNLWKSIELALSKREYRGVLVFGLDAEVYAEQLLLDYPEQLLSLLNRDPTLQGRQDIRKKLLAASLARLISRERSQILTSGQAFAAGRMEMELGLGQSALRHFNLVLQLDPLQENAKYKRNEARIEVARPLISGETAVDAIKLLEDAENEMREMIKSAPGNAKYRDLLESVKKLRMDAITEVNKR